MAHCLHYDELEKQKLDLELQQNTDMIENMDASTSIDQSSANDVSIDNNVMKEFNEIIHMEGNVIGINKQNIQHNSIVNTSTNLPPVYQNKHYIHMTQENPKLYRRSKKAIACAEAIEDIVDIANLKKYYITSAVRSTK